ncbi:MAG: beta-ketoacyl-ACP synthase II [Planctomycetota bacterium]|nr:beta-ketoacyl-ACP synthase II [Planctomycetota bacterium]MEC8162102.1 beta-ketoacyl-ACP synthase II [Planctomycetota bacterium]MEC8864021.1 beta-ketoacyl-ACP synthase II [Planctomycetota bacterium]MED5577087.1 beta-ketoacyl-ACP synthase II [Planctomycetota bacterium]MEE3031819.1 beta-ketoacyl-ACP synthase II [Planctomycetota bacterium]
MKRRVVISGLGVVTSLSCKVDDLWSRVLAGESGIHPIRLFDVSDFKVTIGGDIYDWNPSDYIDPKELKRLDRFTQFAIVAATDAVADSGIDFSSLDSFRSGVILGSGIGGLSTIEEQMSRLMTKGPNRVSPLTIPKLMLNAAGGNISIKYGIRGPNYTVATACASATNALGDALKCIQYGDADVMITGGAEAAMTRMGLSAFQNMKALSTRVDSPEQASRPFENDRDGFVFSEGAGIVIFEELEHAKARGAKIYAEVLGYGTSGDAGHITQPDEEGTGAAKAMSTALTDADLAPDQVDYINAHGTSTPLGDKAETRAVKSVFGAAAEKLSISSTKSQLGHSLGASGGIELVLCVKALQEQTVPPTINFSTPDPECDLDYTPNEPKSRSLNYVMSNSFGFGGHNASVVVGRYS